MKTNFSTFPKLEDWAYKDLVAFYTKATNWKINFTKELKQIYDNSRNPAIEKFIKEILGQ